MSQNYIVYIFYYQAQKDDSSGLSIIQVYRKAAKLRKEPSFQNAKLQFCVVHDNILSYVRHTPGHAAYLVALNLGNEPSTDDYTTTICSGLKMSGEVVLVSGDLQYNSLHIGKTVNLKTICLYPAEAVIVQLDEE